MKNSYRFLLYIFAFFLFVGSTFAKDIYVNEQVSSSGSCLTEATACKTFSDAMNKAVDGDKIILKSDVEDNTEDTIFIK